MTAGDDEQINATKNEEAFVELIQFLDDKSLSLVMRDAQDDKSTLRWYRQAESDFIIHGIDIACEVGTQDSDRLCYMSRNCSNSS